MKAIGVASLLICTMAVAWCSAFFWQTPGAAIDLRVTVAGHIAERVSGVVLLAVQARARAPERPAEPNDLIRGHTGEFMDLDEAAAADLIDAFEVLDLELLDGDRLRIDFVLKAFEAEGLQYKDVRGRATVNYPADREGPIQGHILVSDGQIRHAAEATGGRERYVQVAEFNIDFELERGIDQS